MIRAQLLARSIVLLLCLAFLAMRAGGAHLHLCFDGNGEPLASVHLTDDGLHHAGEGAQSAHHDVDVSLVAELFDKKFEGILPLSALFAAALALFTLPVLAVIVAPRTSVAPLEPLSAFRRLPPLRGPPV
jgi:hypothetical protein